MSVAAAIVEALVANPIDAMPCRHREPAGNLLVFQEAQELHRTLIPLGFVLMPTARAWRHRGTWTVRLVWRRRRDNQSATLALRWHGA